MCMPLRDHDRVLTRGVSWSWNLESGEETTRESGGYWRIAALEVRRVRTLTSRVALRGVSWGNTGKDSTSDEMIRSKQKDSVAAIKGGGKSSLADPSGASIFEEVGADTNELEELLINGPLGSKEVAAYYSLCLDSLDQDLDLPGSLWADLAQSEEVSSLWLVSWLLLYQVVKPVHLRKNHLFVL
ncbi:hypothetical protein NDU88_005101 [Pleurodeles waltl]|uniref:Uncharacterized protein n=1 Tax=Pleurodeles waltl TaxID=8319 RepID=A0AAV7M8A7_PLEWA|nr:hypothetical protein NDU88_005101 [Pleurodeles waltl]